MRPRFVLILLLVGLTLSGAPAPLGAAPRKAPRPRASAAQKKRARALFFKGLRSFGLRNYPDALARFSASYRLVPKNVVLYNIAMCHRALFEYTKAISAFRRYLDRKGRRLLPFKRRLILRMIASMKKKLGRLKLLVLPEGAEIRVDGRPVGRAPLDAPLLVDPGRRVVEVSLPGHRTATLSITVVSGQLVSMGVSLQPIRRQGRLVLTCAAPRCRARVDQGPLQDLPATLSLSPGTHRVRFRAPGYLAQQMQVRVFPNETVRQDVHLVPGAGGVPGRSGASVVKTWWFWTVLSVAVVAVGTTTGWVVWDQTRDHTRTDLTWQLR